MPRIEVAAGHHGFFNVLNTNRVPLGGLVTLRNMTLADFSWRTGGGAVKLGVPIPGLGRIIHATDYWPASGLQRTLVISSNGSVYKDNGAGAGWVSVAAGLVQGGRAIPHFAVAGAEAAGRARKLFYVDRVNSPQVLTGDGTAMAAMSKPAADWTGTNQPGWMIAHQGYNWAGGNLNAPHTVYRSLATDHENFSSQPYALICGPETLEQYTVAGLSYKGGLVIGKFPVGTYWINTSTDPDPLHWAPQPVALPGWAGPHAGGVVEDDVIWMAPDGSWHSLSAVLGVQKASMRASSLTYRKLTSWPAQFMNLGRVADSDFIYYAERQELMLSFVAAGSVQIDRRLHLDLNNRSEVGENWILWDRDLNSCLFLRQLPAGRLLPVFGDYTGQLWSLDQEVRSKDGAAYEAEILMADTDLSMLYPHWAGRKKNGRFLQIEYVSTSRFDVTVEIWFDGVKTQTMTVTLIPGGAVLPVVLPFQLGGAPLRVTPYLRLLGQFVRIAVRISATVVAGDMNITKLLLGCELAA